MPERTICLRDWESRTLRDLPAGGTLLLLRPVVPRPPAGAQALIAADGSSDVKFVSSPCAGVGVARTPWIPCPFGAPGDVLLGKEAWTCYPTPGCTFGEAMMGKKITLEYRAGGTQEFSGGHATGAGMHIDWSALDFDYPPEKYGAWQPAQRLPRALVRHRPRVESVAVLPVQGLTEEQARNMRMECYRRAHKGRAWENLMGAECRAAKARDPLATEVSWRDVLAVACNREWGKRHPWESNPWAWAVTVRREE
jgi:hypothetical protein